MPVSVVPTYVDTHAPGGIAADPSHPSVRVTPKKRRHHRRGHGGDHFVGANGNLLTKFYKPIEAGITGLLKKIALDKTISGQDFSDLMKFNRGMLLPFQIISAAFFQESYKKGHIHLTPAQAQEFEAFVGKLDKFGLVSLCTAIITDLLDHGVKTYFLDPEQADSFEDMLMLMLAEFVRRMGRQSEEKKAYANAAAGKTILGKNQAELHEVYQSRAGDVDRMMNLAQSLVNQMQVSSQQSFRQW